VSGVLMAKFLEKLPMFRLNSSSSRGDEVQNEKGESRKQKAENSQSLLTSAPTNEKPAVKEATTLQPLKWWGGLIIAAFLLFFVFLFLRLVFPENFGLPVTEDTAKQNLFIRIVSAVSLLSIPFLLSAIPLFAILRRVKVYEEFVDGAKEGFDVAIRIIPYLVAMLVAVGMFRAAGGIDLFSRALSPVLNLVGFPTDLLPMCLVRPLSGSGSLGFFTELVKTFGADSLIARTGGTIYGSTETTFYVLAVYFGSVAVKRTRHALLAGLTADFTSVVVAVIVCRAVFG
jgi:spore maturation protein B